MEKGTSGLLLSRVNVALIKISFLFIVLTIVIINKIIIILIITIIINGNNRIKRLDITSGRPGTAKTK